MEKFVQAFFLSLFMILMSCGQDEIREMDEAVVCPGDPIPAPRVAPQLVSGIEGGLFGCTRYGTGCPYDEGRKWHGGIDLLAEYGDPIYSIYSGDATLQTDKDAEGNIINAGHYVQVKSLIEGKDLTVLYFHLQEEFRVSGSVSQGEIIGYLGVSGNLEEAINEGYAVSHVHVEVWADGVQVDPTGYLTTKIDSVTGEVLAEGCADDN